MGDVTGEAREPSPRVAFDCQIKLEFHGARIATDGRPLTYRERDDALDLSAMAAATTPAEQRRGEGIRRQLTRFAGCEDFEDGERLARQSAVLAIGRCERLATPQSRSTRWIDSTPGGWRPRT